MSRYEREISELSFSFFLTLAAESSLSALLAEVLRIVVLCLNFYDLKNHQLVLLIDHVCVE